MGSVSIKKQSQYDGSLKYPIINKIMKFQPDKQYPLAKPHSHSNMIEETYEMNYLEIILNVQEIAKKKVQEQKAISTIPVEQQQQEKTLEQQITKEQELIDFNQKKQLVGKNLKMKRSFTQNSNHPELFDECSVIQNKNQTGSDTQTIRSILRTNKSRSHKSVPKATQYSYQKKVSFDPRLLKQKNQYFFM